jgi:hypothetical protein
MAEKNREVVETITHPLTPPAPLVPKVESWMQSPGHKKLQRKQSSLHQICSERDVHQTLAYTICFPVLQGDVMELQRGVPLVAAISVEKSPLLACIKGRVAAEDDDHFAAGVWVRRQTDRQQTSRQSRQADKSGKQTEQTDRQAAGDLGDCF